MKRTVSLILAALLLLGALAVGIAAVANAASATAAAPGRVYKTANASSEPLTTVKKGDCFRVIAEVTRSGQTWYKVCVNNCTGYLQADCVRLANAGATAYVSTDTMKVYKTKGRNARLLTTLEKGDEVTILTRYRSGWTKVSADGVTGYCNFESLTLTAPKGDSLAAILEQLTKDIELPMTAMMELTEENFSYFTFAAYQEGYEGIVSEPMMSSVAHSVVLVRAKDAAAAKALAWEIEQNADPRKWICVEAEEVEVEVNGNLVLLVMSTEDVAETIADRFEALN